MYRHRGLISLGDYFQMCSFFYEPGSSKLFMLPDPRQSRRIWDILTLSAALVHLLSASPGYPTSRSDDSLLGSMVKPDSSMMHHKTGSYTSQTDICVTIVSIPLNWSILADEDRFFRNVDQRLGLPKKCSNDAASVVRCNSIAGFDICLARRVLRVLFVVEPYECGLSNILFPSKYLPLILPASSRHI